MIGKLRIRFILVTMLSLLLVLGVIIGGINIISYIGTVRNADNILQFLGENGGRFPEMPPMEEQGLEPGEMPPQPGEFVPGPEFSPEVAYETRYFYVLFGEDGDIIVANTGMIAAISEEEAETLGRNAYEHHGEKGFEGDYRYLKVKEGGNTRIIFYDCGRSLDSFRLFRSSSLLISAAGVIVVFILIFFTSGRIVRPVAESYEKQKRFITDAGHEIKTPLAIINSDADVILSDGESQWAEDIKTQVGRLTELTNDLIYLSKMEEGLPEVAMESVDLKKIVKESCDSFASRFITGKKKLVEELQDGISLKGDSKALSQLMSILLDNALKYSPEGGTTSVILRQSSKGISLYVTNNTADPVDGESAKHLFDRFYRTDKSRNSETGGYGIGLSIAQAIVTAHKGKISAEPSEDGKLTIKVTFS